MQILWLVGLHLIFYFTAAIVVSASLGVLSAGIGATLIWISVWDCRKQEIPDIANFLLFALSAVWLVTHIPYGVAWVDHIVGGIFWPVLFWTAARFHYARHQQHGLGLGDVKLMAGLGVLLGFTGAVYAVLMASVAAMITLLLVARINAQHFSIRSSDLWGVGLAFGPFLCASSWSLWLHHIP